MSKPLTSYTEPITELQAHQLRELLKDRGFEFGEKPWSIFSAKKGKLNVTVYEKGPKVLVQGKETEDFVKFILEPEIFGEAKLGYEELHNPKMFEPHIGVDESGKGDFFGPLVIAGVYVDGDITRALMEVGVTDSKKIGTDGKIRALSEAIRGVPGVVFEIIRIGPERYNEMYANFRNLNRLLAWGHARVIENLLARRPDCPRALSDQFANPREIERALQGRGRQITMEQRTKAESDTAVAAASILARESFIDWMRDTSEAIGIDLPKGASALVKAAGSRVVAELGSEKLAEVGKMHFKTSSEILSGT